MTWIQQTVALWIPTKQSLEGHLILDVWETNTGFH